MEAINKQTGVTTLSCEHSFHFRCIDDWFYKQLSDGHRQSCPCCRGEGGELDRCAFEEVEDDDDETYEDAESQTASVDDDDRLAEMLMSDEWILERNVRTGQLLFTPAIEVSLSQVRNLFGPLNDLDAEPTRPIQDTAARKIQAIFRGYKTRETFQAVRALHQLAN